MTTHKFNLLLLLFISFACSNTLFAQDALFISPTNGNVGIGTSSPPVAKLEVNGDIKLGLDKKIWWDWESRAIDVINVNKNAGTGIMMRFRNSMSFNQGNRYGGFDFEDNAGRSVLRIVDHKVGIGNDTPKVALDVNGDIKASGSIKDRSGYVVPVGGIIMYSGALSNFYASGIGKENTPVEGWALCNGKDGRPDLQDRFVVGAGREYYIGETGGEKKHQLIEAEMPSHSHSYGFGGGNSGSYIAGNDNGNQAGRTYFQQWTNKTGSNAPHENRPPYYAIAYIMKL